MMGAKEMINYACPNPYICWCCLGRTNLYYKLLRLVAGYLFYYD